MTATSRRITLEELFGYLDAMEARPGIGELLERLGALDVSLEDVAHVARFSPEGYRRNLLREGRHYHALVLCWRSGQRSPIHDHARSVCGVRVIRGVATETVFERTACGQLKATRSRDLREGEVCASRDADIHQVANLQARGQDLVTLHVYSPPLREMKQYTLEDARGRVFVDPVFVDGGGI